MAWCFQRSLFSRERAGPPFGGPARTGLALSCECFQWPDPRVGLAGAGNQRGFLMADVLFREAIPRRADSALADLAFAGARFGFSDGARVLSSVSVFSLQTTRVFPMC